VEVVEAARDPGANSGVEGEAEIQDLPGLRLQSLAAARQLRELAVRPLGSVSVVAPLTVFGRRHTLHAHWAAEAGRAPLGWPAFNVGSARVRCRTGSGRLVRVKSSNQGSGHEWPAGTCRGSGGRRFGATATRTYRCDCPRSSNPEIRNAVSNTRSLAKGLSSRAAHAAPPTPQGPSHVVMATAALPKPDSWPLSQRNSGLNTCFSLRCSAPR